MLAFFVSWFRLLNRLDDVVCANHDGTRCDWLGNHGVCANLGVVANRNVADYLGAGANNDVVADGWVTLGAGEFVRAEGYLVINQNVIPDFGRLANYYADAMVNDKPTADGCARVNLNCGPEFGPIRQHTGGNSPTPAPHPIRDAVGPDRPEAWRSEDQLECGQRCRVAVETGPDVFADSAQLAGVNSS